MLLLLFFYLKIYSLIAKSYLDLWIKICYHSIAAKSRADVLLVVLPQIGVRQHSRNILKVFYPTGAAHGLTSRCAVARHGSSRELGPCPKKLDGLSCMHQLFPGREPHQLYFVVLERGMLCKSIRNRCSCRTVPATRRSPGLLTVLSLSVNGARPYSG